MISSIIEKYQLLLGIPIGVLTTFVWLWISHNLLAPRMVFSKDIRRMTLSSRKPVYLYAVKTRNTGRRRLVDVTVHCRLSIHDLARNGKHLWTFFNVKTTFNNSITFGKGVRIYHFDVNTITNINAAHYIEKEFGPLIKENRLRLEDIFLKYKKIHLQYHVIGHDSFTGIKKVYTSPKYKIYNVDCGTWSGLDLIRHIDNRKK